MKKKPTDLEPILRYLPPPPNVQTRLMLRDALGGHSTSPRWLPEGLWPELDTLRAEQLRLRDRTVAALADVTDLEEKHAAEDRAHAEALRQAHRDGVGPPDDRRTPTDRRAEQRSRSHENLWSAVAVLGEHAERIVETVRENEDRWMADLRDRLPALQEQRREAERQLAQANAAEYRLHRLGRWLQNEADDQAFSRQPAPSLDDPLPPRVASQALSDSLTRPWHRLQPWNDATGEPEPEAEPEADATGEPTGAAA